MKKVSFVKQTSQTECGICCLAMVANYYGYVKKIAYYRDFYSIGRDGTSIKEMYDIFNTIGFDVDIFRCKDLNDFDFEENKPYILFCKECHFIDIQIRKSKVYVSDPAGRQYKSTLDEMNEIYTGIIIYARPNCQFVPANDNISEFRYIKNIINDNIGFLLLTLSLSVVTYISSIIVPILLQQIIDSTSVVDSESFKQICAQIGVLLCIYLLMSFARNRVNIILEKNMLNRIGKETMYHIFKIPYSFFDNRSSGNILYRLGIIDHLRDVVATNFIDIIMDTTCVLCVIIYVGVAFKFLLCPAILTFIFIGIYIYFVGEKSVRLQRDELYANEKLNDIQTEIVTNIFQIKCLRLETFFWNNFRGIFDEAKDKFVKEKIYSADTSMIYSMFSVFLPIIFAFGSFYATDYELSKGRMVLIYSLTVMLMNFSSSLFNSLISIYEMKAHLFYLNDLLDEKEVISSGINQVEKFTNLEMKEISFKYTTKGEPIFDDFSMKINNGEKIAIVGATGRGKTTLVKILAGLYEVKDGDLMLNGYKYDEIDEKSKAQIFTIVPQIPIVFNKTIRENITLGDGGISDEEIIQALDTVCLLEDINNMPMGINTYISGQGGNLSGGQIQRLSLARAIVRKPQLLILDEATSSLDASTENQIYANLKTMELTMLVISHRLSTVRDANRIYYLEENLSYESGTHKQLYANNMSYKNLCDQQFVHE